MNNTQTVHRYTKALLALAKKNDQAKAIDSDMRVLSDALDAHPDLEAMLNNPIIKPMVKLRTLNAVFEGLNSFTEGLFEVLAKNKRLASLRHVALHYQTLYHRDTGGVPVEMSTTIAMDDAFLAAMSERLSKSLNRAIDLTNKVNPELIGGFVLRYGDFQYDASIGGKLKELKQVFDK